jgi:hypothetical protein
MEYMKGLIARKHAKKNKPDGHKPFVEEDTLDFEGNAIPVHDPAKVTTKGAQAKHESSTRGESPCD